MFLLLYVLYASVPTEGTGEIGRFHSRGENLCKFIGKMKAFTQEKSSTPTGLVWNTNMAAVSLFWNIACEQAFGRAGNYNVGRGKSPFPSLSLLFFSLNREPVHRLFGTPIWPPWRPVKTLYRVVSILGDPEADRGGEGKSKRAGKYGATKSKGRREEPLGTMSYQTGSKLSRSFWLLIWCQKTFVFFCPIRGQNGGDSLELVW